MARLFNPFFRKIRNLNGKNHRHQAKNVEKRRQNISTLKYLFVCIVFRHFRFSKWRPKGAKFEYYEKAAFHQISSTESIFLVIGLSESTIIIGNIIWKQIPEIAILLWPPKRGKFENIDENYRK